MATRSMSASLVNGRLQEMRSSSDVSGVKVRAKIMAPHNLRTDPAHRLCSRSAPDTAVQGMSTMVLRLVIASGIIAGLAVTTPRAQQPARQETFRSAVDLVTIQASVKDARGRTVSGLTTTDFEVRDNGELRPILSLRSDRQSPLSLAILVDMSGSMRVGPKIAMARRAYCRSYRRGWPG